MAGNVLLSGTFTSAPAYSATQYVHGPFRVSIWSTPLNGDGTSPSFTATVAVESSEDGSTWVPVSTDGTGAQAIYNAGLPLAVIGYEPVNNMLYRFHCISWGAGTINYRLSQIQSTALPFFRSV